MDVRGMQTTQVIARRGNVKICPSMSRPVLATLHTSALQHNLQRCHQCVPDAKVWAVIKANAYGHGIERTLEALRSADGFAVLDLHEAQRVRSLGWRGPILLLEGVFEPRDLELCSQLNVWHTIHCNEQIDMLAAHKTKVPHRVFLKMNTGMNRLGFPPERYLAAWTRLSALPQVDDISLMTHFSRADANDGDGIAEPLHLFNNITQGLPGERSLLNSAATLRYGTVLNAAAGDWVRPGIMLYGSSPDHPAHTASDWNLQSVMTLSSKIIATQAIGTGAGVGYGSAFVATQPMHIGVVACGYADGYPRHCPTGTPVLVAGCRAHLVGRISMDMMAVNLTALLASGKTVGVGSEVTLWGRASNNAVLGIDEVAHSAGTLGYELMCALAPRVRVQVVD